MLIKEELRSLMLLARDLVTIESTYGKINRRLEQSILISSVCSVAARLIRNSDFYDCFCYSDSLFNIKILGTMREEIVRYFD